MNAYNPLASMKRLEEAGVPRGQAEAIAGEIGDARQDLVTKDFFREQLEAALSRQTIRLTAIVGAMLTLVCTVIGTIVALLAAYK